MHLLLASTSPRRRRLLRDAGFSFHTRAPQVDESHRHDERAEHVVARLAAAKARDVARRFPDDTADAIIGADTVVAVDNAILGKPADRADAAAMLRQLSGRSHRVLTGMHVIAADTAITRVCESTVMFTALSDAAISRYLDTNEFTDKAGAYALQGAAADFVTTIHGARDTVIGLPLTELRAVLSDVCGRCL